MIIRIQGIDKLKKNFKKFEPRLKIKLKEAIIRSAYIVEGKAKPLTPVDTGRLRSSIASRFSFLQAIISPHTDYAIYVHEGTYKIKGRPFMTKGARKAEPQIQKEFKKSVDSVIRKIK